MKRILLPVIILFFLIPLSLIASDLEGDAYHGSNFIKIKPGARANAIGPAYIGFSDDPSTLFWNPAGPVTLLDNYIHTGGALIDHDTYLGNVGFILQTPFSAIGVGIVGYKYKDFPEYNSSGTQIGETANFQGYTVLNFSFFLTDFSSMGFNAKGGFRKVGDNKIYVFTGSMGLMFEYIVQLVLVIDDLGYNYDTVTKEYQYINPDFSFGVSYVSKDTSEQSIFGVSLVVSRGIDLPSDETKIGIGSFIRIFGASSEIEEFFEKKKSQGDAFYLNLGIENYHGINFSGGFTLYLFEIKFDYALVFPHKSKQEFSHYGSIEISF